MRASPLLISLALLVSCVQTYDLQETVTAPEQRKLGFDISVTREGEKVHPGRIATRSAVNGGTMVDASAITATMDINRPFSLIGVEKDSRSVLIDNTPVYSSTSGNYSLYLDNEILNIPSKVLLSAYYPHVRDLKYGEDHYTIPFSVSEARWCPKRWNAALTNSICSRWNSDISPTILASRFATLRPGRSSRDSST